jgi:hypothetical protein
MCRKLICLITIVMLAGLTSSAFGAADMNTTWTGGGSDNLWSTAGNWDDGVPGPNDLTLITTANLTSPLIDSTVTAQTAHLDLGGATDNGTCQLNMTGGSLSTIVSANYNAYIGGMSAGGVATMNHSGGTIDTWILKVGGDYSTGTYNISGSALSLNAGIQVGGWFTTGNGTVNMTGGTIDETYWTQVGLGGTGVVNMSGGLWGNQSTGLSGFALGWGGCPAGMESRGTLNMSGGTIDELWVLPGIGPGGIGIINQTGGLIDTSMADGSGRCSVAQQVGSYGRWKVWGGTVLTDDVEPIGGNGIFDFQGSGIMIIPDVNGHYVPYLQAYVTDGQFTGYGVADLSHVIIAWDSRNRVTTVTGVPEPATIALLGMGGLALLRRKRK